MPFSVCIQQYVEKSITLYFVFCDFILHRVMAWKVLEASIVFAIYMFIYFASRMTLIAMFGGYITKTTSVSEMLEALNRMKVPRSIGIPFSVLLRFVPTIKIELKALKENMKIRGIVTSRFFPCYIQLNILNIRLFRF